MEAPTPAHAATAAPTPAHAATAAPAATHQAGAVASSPAARAAAVRAAAIRIARVRGARIVAAAGAQHGKPYRRGAQGPVAFDCSGLSSYAYRAVNIHLPRTADQQYRTARRISSGAARAGDLVFWVSGKHAYHVAVYAGAGRVWHAPKPGDRIRLAKIWSPKEVRFGRIGV
ncbi:C40 family peptidase [Actinoplanes sp. KI2]|uniref:C40 family peptidase n=1 Tax=Actinoplanes sp. KI2 TaxID=2983315 RepID=UPI0021D57B30|nr:C40 family peptidase [Actinoplanes sp. KI2]MCU7726519.1 C40 family peptidase [Actinoplanes sp. KI2]